MSLYEGPIQDLIDELARLPGIGPKSAQRLAFYLVKATPEEARHLSDAITQVKERVTFCTECGNVAEGDLCKICRDPSRDLHVICVVEEPKDAATIEKAGVVKGRYHILGGAISPLDGIGPEDLRVSELERRVQENGVTEVILATNPNLEGNATAMYVAAVLKPSGVRVSRLASGLPVGGDLEYADEVTLSQALEGRREM
jgi:recombination protein RecR